MPVQPAAAGVAVRAVERQRVLIVDDDHELVASLKAVIEIALNDVDVLVAPSGALALELLQRQPVNLIITDQHMPGLDGVELLRHARGLYPQVPRIMMTGYPTLPLATRALREEQVAAFWTKPFHAGTVVVSVASLLHQNLAYLARNQALARSLMGLRDGFRSLRDGT